MLPKAVQYGQVHREGSFLNHEYPRIKAIRAYRQQRQMPGVIVSSFDDSSADESASVVSKVFDQASDIGTA